MAHPRWIYDLCPCTILDSSPCRKDRNGLRWGVYNLHALPIPEILGSISISNLTIGFPITLAPVPHNIQLPTSNLPQNHHLTLKIMNLISLLPIIFIALALPLANAGHCDAKYGPSQPQFYPSPTTTVLPPVYTPYTPTPAWSPPAQLTYATPSPHETGGGNGRMSSLSSATASPYPHDAPPSSKTSVYDTQSISGGTHAFSGAGMMSILLVGAMAIFLPHGFN